MIPFGGIKDLTLQALIQIASSREVFHPCGSRFFGFHEPSSDYDFFCSSSPIIQQEIEYMGFGLYTPKNKNPEWEDYHDLNWVATWQKADVHIIQVKSPEARIACQNYIKSTGAKWKKGDAKWWTDLYVHLGFGNL